MIVTVNNENINLVTKEDAYEVIRKNCGYDLAIFLEDRLNKELEDLKGNERYYREEIEADEAALDHLHGVGMDARNFIGEIQSYVEDKKINKYVKDKLLNLLAEAYNILNSEL